jgi:hypothetical protein
MPAQRGNIFRAPLGYAFLRGEQVAKVTDVSISYAGTELTARSGCDKTPWFRAIDSYDLTGAFSTQVVSPLLMSLVTGGEVVATNGYSVVQDEAPSSTGTVLELANSDIHTYADADGNTYGQVVIVNKGSTGDTMLDQVVAASPAAGEFYVQDSASGWIEINAAEQNDTLNVTYLYQEASQNYFELEKDDEPPYLSLGIPLCGYALSDLDTQKASTLWIPKVRILSWDGSAATGAGDLQSFSFNWTAVPDGNNAVFRLY